MISTNFENVSFTTFSGKFDNPKVFYIETNIYSLSEKNFELLAKRFCKAHQLEFQKLTMNPSYSIGPWQHSPLYGFEAKSLPHCMLWL